MDSGAFLEKRGVCIPTKRYRDDAVSDALSSLFFMVSALSGLLDFVFRSGVRRTQSSGGQPESCVWHCKVMYHDSESGSEGELARNGGAEGTTEWCIGLVIV